jgi:hypothetical protein
MPPAPAGAAAPAAAAAAAASFTSLASFSLRMFVNASTHAKAAARTSDSRENTSNSSQHHQLVAVRADQQTHMDVVIP